MTGSASSSSATSGVAGRRGSAWTRKNASASIATAAAARSGSTRFADRGERRRAQRWQPARSASAPTAPRDRARPARARSRAPGCPTARRSRRPCVAPCRSSGATAPAAGRPAARPPERTVRHARDELAGAVRGAIGSGDQHAVQRRRHRAADAGVQFSAHRVLPCGGDAATTRVRRPAASSRRTRARACWALRRARAR